MIATCPDCNKTVEVDKHGRCVTCGSGTFQRGGLGAQIAEMLAAKKDKKRFLRRG